MKILVAVILFAAAAAATVPANAGTCRTTCDQYGSQTQCRTTCY